MTSRYFGRPKVYAAKLKDRDSLAASQSGGAFVMLSDMILGEGGVVYGCVLDDNLSAVHTRAETSSQRDAMRGSKYVQSSKRDTFRSVKADLLGGRKVMYTGTSCEIAGLRAFLGELADCGGLICVDIVCHGVPSPAVWKRYLAWQEERNSGRVAAVDFRNKKDFGWDSHIETLTFEDGTKVNSEVFKNLFYGHNILRPSCYECPFKSIMHPGDITIGDFWGIDKAMPEFYDKLGVSLILINTAQGERFFESVKDRAELRESRIEDAMQRPLISPYPVPSDREEFWRQYRDSGFEAVAKRWGLHGAVGALRRRARRIKKAIGRIKEKKIHRSGEVR